MTTGGTGGWGGHDCGSLCGDDAREHVPSLFVMVLQPESKPCYSVVLAGIAMIIMPGLDCSAVSKHDGDTLKGRSVV